MSLSDPILTAPGAGRTVEYGHGSSAELKIAGEQSGGDWAVVEWRVRAGDEPPMHTHTREDETLYLLEGAITAYVGGEKIEVEVGFVRGTPQGCAARPDRPRRGSATTHHTGASGRGVLIRASRRFRCRPSQVRSRDPSGRPGDVKRAVRAGLR
jgi:Cupin domain